jgi:hypothetical protein
MVQKGGAKVKTFKKILDWAFDNPEWMIIIMIIILILLGIVAEYFGIETSNNGWYPIIIYM